MYFMWTTTEIVKKAWPAFLMMALVIVLIVVSGLMVFSRCSSETSGPDHFDDAKGFIEEQLRLEREKNDQKLLELQESLDALQYQVELIDAEIAESARQREETHDAIDNAGTIDDIDRVLKGGIPRRTGGRRNP